MMPQPVLRAYADRLPSLVAEYQGVLANAAAYPYMDAAGQREMRRAWQTPRTHARAHPRPRLSRPQYAARLASLGFGFVVEPRAPESEVMN